MHFKPSIVAHTVHAFLVLFAVGWIIVYFSKLQALDAYRALVLILLFAIVMGIHGISHLGLEQKYGYSPYNWYTVEPTRPIECPCMEAMKKMATHGS